MKTLRLAAPETLPATKRNDIMNGNDLWDVLGSLDNDEAHLILAELFARYEQRRERDSTDPEADFFFQALGSIISRIRSCNVNRR
jgi:hypothetical protein